MTEITPVILCGGSGTRLWPLSRASLPKQFLRIIGKDTLFQQAAQRLSLLRNQDITVNNPVIVTSENHKFIVREQMRNTDFPFGKVILEPVGRNTAPALTMAALEERDQGRDPLLVITPSDQSISDSYEFTNTIHKAIEEAEKGNIVIFGIKPDRPETGFGYIHSLQNSKTKIWEVQRFVEKPSVNSAEKYLNDKEYFWNSGIFVVRASIWLSVLEQLSPDVYTSSKAAWMNRTVEGDNNLKFIHPGEVEFKAIRPISIDYAVMEKFSEHNFPLKMIPLQAGWNDLGSWNAVWDVLPKDENGNANIGDVVANNCNDNLVYSSTRLVTLVGVSDMIVVDTDDALLILDKSRSQEVSNLVSQLHTSNRDELSLNRKIDRPWGWYDTIKAENNFKVKHIQVKPDASLSLQKHHQRSEHWVVLKGTAEVRVGDDIFILYENQSTFIPLGEVHRLTNVGTITLEIIEVQLGEYLGEDDIVRLDDIYGRIKL